jgi:hypothetical protein
MALVATCGVWPQEVAITGGFFLATETFGYDEQGVARETQPFQTKRRQQKGECYAAECEGSV